MNLLHAATTFVLLASPSFSHALGHGVEPRGSSAGDERERWAFLDHDPQYQGAAWCDGSMAPLTLRVHSTGDPILAELDAPTLGMFGHLVPIPRDERELTLELWPFRMRLDIRVRDGRVRGDLLDRQGVDRGDVELLRVPRSTTPAVAVEPRRFHSLDGTELAGVLVQPESPGPHPAVVLVQGRGYGPGRGNLSLAVACARAGVAAFLFDGRGTGESAGERGRHTLVNRLDDAEAALLVVREDPRIDPERVGMWGFSAGGWVVPVVAQRREGVSFLILQVAPGVSLAEQQGQVVRELARRGGEFTAQELEATFEYQRTLVELAGSGASWPEIEAHVSTAEGEAWAGFVDRPRHDGDAELDYFRRCPHDSVPALRATRVPLLALYGGGDPVVPPAYNVPALEEHLAAAGNTDHRIVVFPGADHGMFHPGSGDEEPFRWRRRPPGYLDTLLGWMVERVR